MAKINVLSFEVANLIAAGEVVDRPASVIKELMENSIDAGAKHITVEIQHGGVTFMRVADDGCGIEPDDLPVSIRRHATSKIGKADDLDGITTLGFRGEALAAIAAVSDLRILTRTKNEEYGRMLVSSAGEIKEIIEQGSPIGTTVIVENLFANVPARRKFLKKDAAETTAVTTYVEKIALSRPDIAVRLIVDGNMRLDTAGDGWLESAVFAVFGRDFLSRMLRVKSVEGDVILVDGYIGRPDNVRPKRNYQNFFVNGRYVNSRTITAAVEQAYTSYIASEKFPCCVLNITIPPEAVDVNVHPAKLEVKFSNEKMVFEMVYYAVRAVLVASCERPDMRINTVQPTPQNAFAPIEEGKGESLQSRQIKMQMKPAEKPARDETPFSIVTPADLKDHLRSFHVKAASLMTEAPKPEEPQPLPIPGIEEAVQELIALGCKPPEPPVYKSEETFYPPAPGHQVTVCDPEEPQEDAWRIVGEIFHSYILVEQEDKLVIIDKHAAHERVIFEELKRKLATHVYTSQILMLPMEATISSQDAGVLEEYRSEIQTIGFSYTLQGNTLQVTEIPAELVADGAMDLLTTLAVTLGDGTADATLTRDLLFEKALYQGACKAAIKAGRVYPPEYNKELCKKLFFMTDITVCPHGRPVAMTLSHGHIDRQFKRS